MASGTVVNPVGRPKAKELTPLQKRIVELKKIKDSGKATTAQLDELDSKRAEQATLDLRRLASARVQRVVDSMRQIGNLARLKPTSKQIDQVFSAIKDAVEEAHTKWQGNTVKEKESFNLE